MSTPDPTTVRPYRAGDERELVELFHRVFGRPITEDHWHWKLRRQPPVADAADNVWVAASSDERPIFQYAAIPARFQLGARNATAMVSVDTMTAPEYRRRGLLTRVARQAYSSWRDHGVDFVFGLPNEQWGSRARALGWEPLFPLQWLIRPLRPQAMLARRLRMRPLAHATAAGALWNRFFDGRLRADPEVRIEPVTSADESLDRLWKSCEADSMYSTVRDREWVQWRFLSSPSRSYEVTVAWRANRPVGYCAHSLVGSGNRPFACLADMLAPRRDPASRDALLGHLIRKLSDTAVEAIVTLAVPGTARFDWLRRLGFFPRQRFSVEIVPLAPSLPLESMRDPNNWNLTGADFDVV